MAGARRLEVIIGGDAKGAIHALNSVGNSSNNLGSKLGGFSQKAKLAFAGLTVAAVGFAKSSITAFIDAEKSQAKLAAAFEKFPQLAGANVGALQKLNTELAKKTRFDDDATAAAQAGLASFGLTADQLKKITPLMQDYATRTGKDLPTAAQDLGKAMLGQGRALKAVGLDLKDTGSLAGNFEQVMGGLSDKVGGFAEKEGKTTSGQLAIMQNQFGELQEKVGGALVPALTKLVGVLFSIGEWFAKHKPVLIAAIAGIVIGFGAWAIVAGSAAAANFTFEGSLLAAMIPVVAIGAAIATVAAGVIYAYQHWDGFRTVVDTVARFLKDTLWPALQNIVGEIVERVVPAVQAFAGFLTNTLWPALQKIWDVIANYVIPVVVAVISKWVEFQLAVATVVGAVIGKIAEVVGVFVGFAVDVGKVVFDALGHLGGIVSFVTELPGKITSAAANMWEGLKSGLQAAIDWILRQIDRALGPLDEIIGKLGAVNRRAPGALGGGGSGTAEDVRKFAGRALGGPVTAGSPYLVGERGPELFVPRMSGSIVPNGGGGGTTVINVYADVIDAQSVDRLAEKIRQAQLRTGRRNVTVGLT